MRKVLTLDTLNKSVLKADYAVRGAIPLRAEVLRQQLLSSNKLPFKQITSCNIGNPQQLQQAPITFYRQVAALLEYPDLLDKASSIGIPSDAVQRARQLLHDCGGNIGAYSHSQGIPSVRKHVADFITSRDQTAIEKSCQGRNVFLTSGASQGVMHIVQSLVANDNVGVMIPIPQYPLYTAALALNNCNPVPYYLDESSGWALTSAELQRSLLQARRGGIEVRALCIINPGNPTGNVLSKENMEDVIKFCVKERLVLLADEVYQDNIYLPRQKPFHSFRQVLFNMPDEYSKTLELFSFHSISKGVIGECGRRGGYFECINIDAGVVDQLYKLASISLCPPVQGQIMVDLLVNPPKLGDPSHVRYEQECSGILESLKRRASKLQHAFSRLDGYSCQQAEGAMYLFPTISLPRKAIEAAAKAKMQPDAFYCMEMLNATGVCVVPGSGFGQREGTYHFRSTFLPPEPLFDEFIGLIEQFHINFMKQYK